MHNGVPRRIHFCLKTVATRLLGSHVRLAIRTGTSKRTSKEVFYN
jgi:hypothetical protein